MSVKLPVSVAFMTTPGVFGGIISLNVTFDQGQGVIATKDGREMANYTLIEVSNVTQDGRLVFQGAVVYSTNSTGVLSFLDNAVSILMGEGDITTGDFTTTEWELK